MCLARDMLMSKYDGAHDISTVFVLYDALVPDGKVAWGKTSQIPKIGGIGARKTFPIRGILMMLKVFFL